MFSPFSIYHENHSCNHKNKHSITLITTPPKMCYTTNSNLPQRKFPKMIALTISPGSLTFILSYDRINHSIQAHFSHPYPDNIHLVEREAMDMVSSQFTTLLAPSFVHQMVSPAILQAIAAQARQILANAYQQTGVQIKLDDHDLRY